MDAKTYLNQLQLLRLSIRTLTEEIATLESQMTSAGAVRYDKISVQTSPRDMLPDRIAALHDKLDRLQALKEKYMTQTAQIMGELNGMEDPKHAEVLFRIYVKHQSIRKAADGMKYSEDHLKRLKREALTAFERKYRISER